MTSGTVIFLNGVSSSGKTTLAKELQEQLEQPFLHLALDQFRDSLPDKFRGLNSAQGTTGARGLNVVPCLDNETPITSIVFGEAGKLMLKGMRRAMAVMVEVGNSIIIDDIILEPKFLNDYLKVFEDLEVYFIGVKCAIGVAEARESRRLGRFPGTALSHLSICHAHELYDLEIDTGRNTPRECAARILDRLQSPPTAFAKLRNLRFGSLER